MTLSEAIERVSRHHDALRVAVDELLTRGEILPALIVLYAGVDGMAWLARPAGIPHEPGRHFCEYVQQYLLRATDQATPIDIWAARCAILHTQTPESKLSKTGNAREIWYRSSQGAALVQLHLNKPELPLVINPHGLAVKWTQGVRRFVADVSSEPTRHGDFVDRATDLVDPATLDPPPTPTSQVD